MSVVEERAVWSTAFQNDLPDASFLYIESGGTKDSSGKTTPRTLRHFPYKDGSGSVDLPHLRNALARIPQSNLPADVKASLTKKAQGILAKEGGSRSGGLAAPVRVDFTRAMTSGDFGSLDAGTCANCAHPMVQHDDGQGACGEVGCDCDGYAMYAAAEELDFRYAVAPLTHIDIRDPSANEDGTWTMSGYAAVFNQKTTLYDGRFMRTTEDIAPGAFDRVLREQEDPVHFNYGHDMDSTVASTRVPAGEGSLQLRVDANGLYFLAKVAKDDPDAIRMASKMRTGVLNQASFAFKIRDAVDTTSDLDDGRQNEHRRITDIDMLRDVCATPLGAYRQTVSQLRSYAAAIGQPTQNWSEAFSRQPDFGGELVSRASGSGDERRRALAQMMRDSAKHRKVNR